MASAANGLSEEEWRRLLGHAEDLVGSLAVLDGGVLEAGDNGQGRGEAPTAPVLRDAFGMAERTVPVRLTPAFADESARQPEAKAFADESVRQPEAKATSHDWITEVAESVRVLRSSTWEAVPEALPRVVANAAPVREVAEAVSPASAAQWLPAVVTGVLSGASSGLTGASAAVGGRTSAATESWLSAIPTGGLAGLSGGGRPLWQSLILPPFVSGLLKLFGGGGEDAPPPMPQPFALPKSVHLEGALEKNGRVRTDLSYDATGLPRAAEARSTGGGPTVQVNVQAMDSRSFLDHSEEIARSVRQALWESQVLHDALREV